MRDWAICGLAALATLSLFYMGMSKELCRHIDTYTAAQIEEMKLTCN